MNTWTELYAQLAEPFAPEDIFWRAGAVSRDKKRAQALPYAEPRIYEDRLNRVVGLEWAVTFKPWGDNRIICELTIQGQTRSSTGEENDGFAPGTAAEAQAFKRACVKFGLGRYIYDIPVGWVEYDQAARRLSETPTLAAKFLPGAAATPLKLEYLDNPRASRMHAELGKLGYRKSEEHYALAARVCGRPVKSLTELTEDEAARVYGAAKHNTQQAT